MAPQHSPVPSVREVAYTTPQLGILIDLDVTDSLSSGTQTLVDLSENLSNANLLDGLVFEEQAPSIFDLLSGLDINPSIVAPNNHTYAITTPLPVTTLAVLEEKETVACADSSTRLTGISSFSIASGMNEWSNWNEAYVEHILTERDDEIVERNAGPSPSRRVPWWGGDGSDVEWNYQYN